MNPRSSTRSSKGWRGVGRRDRGALEQRRLRAARLFAKGMRPTEVARELGISRQSATVWHRVSREGGVLAERAGRPPLLTTKELSQVVTLAARLGANCVRSQRGLLFGFLRHTGLQI